MDEIKEVFLEESQELTEGITTLLLEAEEIGELRESDVNQIFRDIHTLKGSSGSVGFTKFTKVAHIFESFLEKIKNKKIYPDVEVIGFLIESIEKLEKILVEEASDQLSNEKLNNYIDSFSEAIEDLSSKKKFDNKPKLVEEDKVEQVKAEIKEADKEKKSINDDKKRSREELLKINGGEILDLFEKIYTILAIYDSVRQIEQEKKDELFRAFHTLKASGQFIGFSIFPNYVHILEDFLDKIRNSSIEYDDAVHSFIKSAVKSAEELIDYEINGDYKKAENIYISVKHKLEGLENNFKQHIKKIIKDVEIKGETDSSEEREKSLKKIVSSSSIRVGLDKIDVLMNKVGDLVITKSMLFQFTEALEDYYIKNLIVEKLEILDRNIRELQESVMSIRMIPMSSVYQKIPKIIRDVSKKLGKDVRFEHYGDTVEIDKLMVESLMDPLTHILRNAIDHGIESKDDRININKPSYGKIKMTAAQESGQIIITIEDDGAGIDTEKVGKKAIESGIITKEELSRLSENDIAMLIFSPGLTTAKEVSDISGRGVGMDVVMNNINSIGGTIKIFTQRGFGTKFVIILPLTLAILDGLNVRVGKYRFVYPLNMVLESFQPISEIVKNVVKGSKEVLIVRDEFIPVIRLHDFFNIEPQYKNLTDGVVIVSKVDTSKVAIFVDEFMTQEQIVVKSLEKNFRKIKGISASTIRGDGSVGLILDIANIVSEYRKKASNGSNDI